MTDSPDNRSSTDAPSGRSVPAPLADLREAVRRTVQQLDRLRTRTQRLEEENQRLQARVDELEADPAAEHDGTALLLDDDPDVLRERIDRFIGLLDEELE